MTRSLTSQNETARLQALRASCAFEADMQPCYDDIVRLLAGVTGAAAASVVFFDARHVVSVGVLGPLSSRVARAQSPLARLLDSGTPIVLADFQPPDEALPQSALRPMRSVAAAPILADGGHLIGAVAVWHPEPSHFSERHVQPLGALARQVEAQLELLRCRRETSSVRERIADARQRLEGVLGVSCDGIWDLDLRARSIEINERLADQLGLPPTRGRLQVETMRSRVHPDDLPRLRRFLVDAVRHDAPVDTQLRCWHVSGAWRSFRLRAIAVHDQLDRPSRCRRLVGTCVDIENELDAQARLQRASRMLGESQALSGCGAWELDLQHQELIWTDEVYRIHEVPPRSIEVDYERALAFYEPQSQEQLRAAIRLAIDCGRGFSLELELNTARGRRLWVRATGGAVFVEGRVARISGAVQDITEARRLHHDLVAAKERAEAASEAKGTFVATMSHEIRTPMHTVLGYADMLRDSDLDAQQLECIDVIRSSGESLLRLIDDILDFSKLEAGGLVFERAACDVAVLAAQAARMLQPRAARKGLELRCQGGASAALADPQRVRQVLTNLIGNAIKFSDSGAIVVTVCERSDEVRVEVADQGIGIASDQLGLLFRDFVQVDSSVRRRFEGAGLGLAISRRLIEAMRGRIGVDSVPGSGSTFWFTLPLAATGGDRSDPVAAGGEDAAPRDASADLQGARVLVVEDNRLNRRLAQRLLEKFGCQVDTAVDGAVAIEKLAHATFDLVLMDCLMPGVDGFEATRRIRANEASSGAHVPIVALTANAMPEDREQCLEAGMDGFLGKPFTRKQLFEAVREQLP